MTRIEMIEKLQDELHLETHGFTTELEVCPGGRQDGLDYGPVLVEIVVLDTDGATVAYRTSTDSHDEDWQLGQIEDVVDEAITYRQQAEDTEAMLAE